MQVAADRLLTSRKRQRVAFVAVGRSRITAPAGEDSDSWFDGPLA
jgi:hypothetical protein